MDDKLDIKSYDQKEISAYCVSLGEKSYRGKQLFAWMHAQLETDTDRMTNLPANMREKIRETAEITSLRVVRELISKEDGTRKYLFGLADGNIIESVLMRYEHGLSVCISSQVGCRMGCRFCASTIDGLVRNLTASEMLDQIYSIQKIVGERVSHVVIMGSGEPLDNFDNFVRFVELVSDPAGLNISRRNITVSTCGLVPNIYRLADLDLKITLAISLHASDDETRRSIMPVAKKYSIKEILEASAYYFDRTGRRVTFEYSLIAGVNDSRARAERLSSLIAPLHAHINLIPVNPVEERSYRQSEKQAIEAFRQILEKNGINVTIRREMGRDIAGACGQLRRHYRDET